MTWLIVAGIVVGLGIGLLASELRPGPPDLGTALERLHQEPVRLTSTRRLEPPSPFDTLGARLVGVQGSWLPRSELALIGRSPARFMGHKLMFALMGLLIPPVIVLASALIGESFPVTLPVVGSLLLAALLWFVPDGIVRGEAKEARVEYLHGVAAYLELVALERAADCGPAEALSRAALVGRGTVFRRIADALDRATLDRRPPWDGLDALAAELALTPLQDVADIMRISGTDGASVYRTLRARAHNLRSELLAEELAKANVDSERMVAPGTALVTLMTVLVGFPAVYQIFQGG
ncbi:hypothetical protein [Streptacidiphilus cavernicola]|uniref:Type II secretion system protein GspF domain-containing protein n=1 Tax=Streptacidiphilus cavernicola TaxID=3342716 RepID=A0ABV6W0R4_9ACTN